MQKIPSRFRPAFLPVFALTLASLGVLPSASQAGGGPYRGAQVASKSIKPAVAAPDQTPEIVPTQTLGGPAIPVPQTRPAPVTQTRPATQTRSSAQTRPPANNRPPAGTPLVPGVTLANASEVPDPNSSQPPAAFGPTPFDLGRIRAVRIGENRVAGAPQRVGNVDLLSPFTEEASGLGVSISQADARNVPTLFGVAPGDFFQINLPKRAPIVLAVNRATAWSKDENGQPYETPLRSAPLIIGGKLYLPVFSIAPLLGAAPRLTPDGTLVLSPTIESVQLFPVRNTVAITIKTSAPVPPGAFKVHTLAADARNPARFYVDFTGFSMGFDAGYSTSVRLVANGTGDVIGARAGQVSTVPNEEITRVTFDLRRPLAANFTPIDSDPTLFALVMGPLQDKAPPVTPEDVDVVVKNLEKDVALPEPRGDLGSRGLGSPSQILRGITVVVDAGHGGRDSGAVGAARSQEKKHVLNISHRLARHLQARGATVHMTRIGDTYPSLSDRVNFANSRRADFFISVHMNANRSRAANGTETFYYTGQSRNFAASVHREFVKATGRRDRGVSQARFFVIRNTSMPSILLECAFISNPTEEAAVNNDAWRERVAKGVAQGVVNYVVRFKRPGISR